MLALNYCLALADLNSSIINFDNKIDSIMLVFKNNLADELLIPVVYQEADKQAYYAKKEQERKDALLKSANIKVATGTDLVNIYFQPCCDEYCKTEITLYKDSMMLAKYNPAIVFPVISAGGIITTAIVGIFVYKEKLSVMQIIGMVLGTASIVFLNL